MLHSPRKEVTTMDILYQDDRIVVAVKPVGVLSTDEPGGMPELLRAQLHTDCIRTVHRLDAQVSGVMVFARSRMAAALLSQQIRERRFTKEYLAVLCGTPSQPSGVLTDLLARDPGAAPPSPGGGGARLSFATVDSSDGMTLVRVRLHTGRTHQIRVQFASRGLPLAGDRKYGASDAPYPIALWSCRLSFVHPQTGEPVTFTCPPPDTAPWDLFTLHEML
ncbi:MAG: hypothetical protein BHV94_05285 [Clostridiales bacterium 59_14]|nr:MAG: hypothetical protein BHV94_05285 [Clostridiales bacterium 59_14]